MRNLLGKGVKSMKINKFIRNASVILIILCLILSLSSCNRAVTFNKDFSECTYNGNSYVSIKTTPGRLCWYPLPSIDSVEKVDNYPLWPIWSASGDPIYATSEKSPNFLIIKKQHYFFQIPFQYNLNFFLRMNGFYQNRINPCPLCSPNIGKQLVTHK